MKLIELIPYLLDNEKLKELSLKLDFNEDADEILVFMKDGIELDAELKFFDSNETDGEMEMIENDLHYFYFFSIDYAVELIENDLRLKNKGFSEEQIAQRLLEYRLNDA